MASLVKDVVVSSSYTGTSKNDLIDYQVPDTPAGPPSPVLVGWHGWGVSQAACYSGALGNPDILTECNQRGWYFLSPLLIDQSHHGHPEAMDHMDQIMAWVIDPVNGLGWDVDTDRIYHMGQSMGGGALGSYISTRYVGSGYPYPPAAAIILSGVLDVKQGLEYADSEVGKIYAHMYFKGDVLTNPDDLEAISAVVMDGVVADPVKSQGKNITAPTYLCCSLEDVINGGVIPAQNQALAALLSDLGKTFTTEWKDGEEHSWNIVSLDAAFDWIEQYSL